MFAAPKILIMSKEITSLLIYSRYGAEIGNASGAIQVCTGLLQTAFFIHHKYLNNGKEKRKRRH
jgi:hypothetical protein